MYDIKRLAPKKLLTLLRGTYNYNILHHFRPLPPTELQINVTYRCNSRCETCHIWQMKPKNELSFAEWRKTMNDPIFSTIERLTIAGGEPTLRPDLVTLVKLYVDSMPRLQFLSLITNGFLPRQVVEHTKKLFFLTQKRNVHLAVTVSLDGIGKTHELMRGAPGAFEKTSSSILALKSLQGKYGFWLGAACIICQKNLYHVKEVEKWCKMRGIPFNYQLVGFHETYVQNLEKKRELDFREKDRKYLYQILQKLAKRRSWRDVMVYYWYDMLRMYKENASRITPCPFLFDAFVLDSFGDIYYCLSERKIGNCRKERSVSDVYYSPENLAFRRGLAKNSCLRCNSACFVRSAIKKDFKKFILFYLTGKRFFP